MTFIRTEPAQLFDSRRKQGFRREFTMTQQHFNQTFPSKLFSRIIERLSYPVRVECEYVSRQKLLFLGRAIPFFEKAQHCGR